MPFNIIEGFFFMCYNNIEGGILIMINFENPKKARLELEIPSEQVFKKIKKDFGEERINSLLKKLKFNPSIKPLKIVVDKFILRSANIVPPDKVQIVDTNEAPVFFAFGERAEVNSYSIALLNNPREQLSKDDHNWFKIFKEFHKIFRPTTIVDYGLELRLYYDNTVHEGIWFNMMYQQDADSEKIVGANFQWFSISDRQIPAAGGKN